MRKCFPLIIAAGLVLAACGGTVPTSTPTGPGSFPTLPPFTPHPSITPSPTPTAAPTPMENGPPWEYAIVPAPIERVTINVAESAPPQYFAHIVSGLPSGCARFNGYETKREGNTINITVTNTMPAPGSNIACTMIYGLHESNVALGSDFISGETYAVIVNEDKSASFVAQ